MNKWNITMMTVLFFLLAAAIADIASGTTIFKPLTKGQADSLYCALTGCTMQGDIDMSGYSIFNTTNITVSNINATNIVGLNQSIEEFGNDTFLRLDTENDPVTGNITFDNHDLALQWHTPNTYIQLNAGGAFIIANTVGSPKVTLSNDQGVSAQALNFMSGQSDHLSLIPQAGYDYYMFELSGAGENKFVRQYGRVGASARFISWSVTDTGDFNLSKDTDVKSFNINMNTHIEGNLNVSNRIIMNGSCSIINGTTATLYVC